ncbi:hypothetical protein [Corallococcus carmarthensis]|uniref:Uncharacterized protein n=1 Tax=Corallococcus carmarthensis TaxID=2316728 RepID=A0A3A8KCV4_9BACT|nr:hypothetical protein [Corallococcus carmarthensis]NOK17270.1 hypothetical protein [Corallococcus carmarthensis]RKH05790.1 hypothetical protein D7X32_06765 [Corallococcus carmarthensis]
MDLREQPGVKGTLTIELRDGSGALVERYRHHNLITTRGKQLLADLLLGRKNALPTSWAIVVGTGTAPADVADTGLKAPIAEQAEDRAPDVAVVSRGTTTVVQGTVSATLPAPPAGTVQPLTEAGIQITVGTEKILFNRVQFPPVNRGANMVMTLSWEISF